MPFLRIGLWCKGSDHHLHPGVSLQVEPHTPGLHAHLLFGNWPLFCLQTTSRSLRWDRTWLKERDNLLPDMFFSLGTYSKARTAKNAGKNGQIQLLIIPISLPIQPQRSFCELLLEPQSLLASLSWFLPFGEMNTREIYEQPCAGGSQRLCQQAATTLGPFGTYSSAVRYAWLCPLLWYP